MDDTVTPLLHWRQRRDSHTLVREDVAEDVRATVDLLARAVMAYGERIATLEASLRALAVEAGGAR